MKTVSASEFKTRCAVLIREVHSTREPVLSTKRDKPFARFVPAGKPVIHWQFEGHLRDHGDTESPAEPPEAWQFD
jgi:antitoxin (DNA-binding transcriptional repressor) of toxin-antitoxin stability system